MLHGNLILPGCDLVHPIDLDSAESGCKFRHPIIQAFYNMLEFSVVSKFLRKLNKAVVLRDQHTALTGRDGFGGVKGIDAGITPRAGFLAVPDGSVGVSAVF